MSSSFLIVAVRVGSDLERPLLEVEDERAHQEGEHDGERCNQTEGRPAILECAPDEGAARGVAAQLQYLQRIGVGFELGWMSCGECMGCLCR